MRVFGPAFLALALVAPDSASAEPAAEPPDGPWVMMLSPPHDPGSRPVVAWISEADVPPPPEVEEGYVNVHWELVLPQPGADGAWTLSRMSYDCGASTFRVLEARRYEGEVLVETTGPEGPFDFMPGTLPGFTMNAVCRHGLADEAPRAADRAAAAAAQAAFLERWGVR